MDAWDVGQRVDHDVDRAIEQVAWRQHGAFSERQARQVGATTRLITSRLARRRWLRLDPNIYALSNSPPSWHRECMAASLSIPGAMVSHSSAATLHRLPGFVPGKVHIVVAPSARHGTALATVHRAAWPRRTSVDGVRTVTVADTFFQLAAQASRVPLRAAFQDAVVTHDGLLDSLLDRYVELVPRRLPGLAVMRDLLAEHDSSTSSSRPELERLLDALLDLVDDLPSRRRQAPWPGWEPSAGRTHVRLDDWRLVVEGDGRPWRTRVDDVERDRWRDIAATSHGFQVVRFTLRQLTEDRSEAFALLQRHVPQRSAA